VYLAVLSFVNLRHKAPPQHYENQSRKQGESAWGLLLSGCSSYRLATRPVTYSTHPSRRIVVSSGPPPRNIAASSPSVRCEIYLHPERGGLCRERARTGRQAPRHLSEISHRPWVLCPAPCLVHIAACRCACPLPQAPPAL